MGNIQSRSRAFQEALRLRDARYGTLVKESGDYRQYLYEGINSLLHRRLWKKLEQLADCDVRIENDELVVTRKCDFIARIEPPDGM
jgi:hypothetical protein